MRSSIPLNRSLLIATLLAAGIASFWYASSSWIQQTAESLLQGRESFENIYVTISGDPVLVRTTSGNTQSTEKILSLDGQSLNITSQDLLYFNGVSPQEESRFGHRDLEWSQRVSGVNDGGVPQTFWYLVHDGRFPGHAYGIGFHASTRTVAGYFGRRGFTGGIPSRDDWFETHGNHGINGQLSVFGTGQEPRWYNGTPRFFLLGDGKIWRIDLAKKTVAEFLDAPSAFQLLQVYRILGSRPAATEDATVYPAASITPMDVMAREPESLLIINQQSGEHRRYPLPEEFRDQTISAAVLPSNQLLLVATRGWRSPDQQIAWLDPSGEIAKQQTIRLKTRYESPSWAWIGWQQAICAPLTIANVAYSLVWGPETALEYGEAEDYTSALALILRKTWPSILAVLVVSAAMAVLAYRHHRRFGFSNSAAWAVFAFLFGVPGWLAYRYHRAWPVLEDCPACRQPAPRDRTDCLDCGAAFPPPPMKGIEVFASSH
jgi:hypothetical protein